SAAELRGVELLERHELRGVRWRVEVAHQQVRIWAGADMSRQAVKLLIATLAVERSSRGEMRDVDAERSAVDAQHRLEHAARRAVARQRMNDRRDDVAAGEDGIAVLAAEIRVAAAVEAVHAGEAADGLVLIVKADLPCAA